MAASAAAASATDSYKRHFAETNFTFLEQQNCAHGRVVQKFYYCGEDIPQAVAQVDQLFEKFRELVPAFSMDSTELVTALQENRYLTINGKAVVLSTQKNGPPGISLEYIDRFFSQALLREPVRCSKGHYLELNAVRYWVENMGDVCPEGEGIDRHTIGSLEVDGEMQSLITAYTRGSLLERLKPPASLVEKKGRKTGMQMMASSGSKVLVKVGVRQVAFSTAFALGTKESAKLASKYAGKYAVPGLGIVIGTGFAIQRWNKKEYVKAFGEIISGLVTIIPGIGIVVSVGIDTVLLLTDLGGAPSDQPLDYSRLEDSYEALALDRNSTPTRQEVDQAYRKIIASLHSDKLLLENEQKREENDQVLVFFNAIKENIYDKRGWV